MGQECKTDQQRHRPFAYLRGSLPEAGGL